MAWNQGMRVKTQLFFPGMGEQDSDLPGVGTVFIPIGHTDTKA